MGHPDSLMGSTRWDFDLSKSELSLEVQTQKCPAGMPGIFACLLKIAVAWLLLFCSLLGCFLDCLLRCLLGGRLFCCFLNGQLFTSFCGFASALYRRGLFRGLSAFCASGFLGGLLGCLLGRSLWGRSRSSSFLGGLLGGRLGNGNCFHDDHALFDNNIVVVGGGEHAWGFNLSGLF